MDIKRILIVAGLLVPSLAFGQALPNISSAIVRYNTLKATAKPEGELKAQIDAVDKEIAEARRTGQNGELRRLIAKGVSLLNGAPWTPALEYRTSLVIRSERTLIDSEMPYEARLEQIYKPGIELSPAITAKVTLRKRPDTPGLRPANAPPFPVARELGTFDGVFRDLRESPYSMELDLKGLADGAYAIETEVLDGSTSLAVVTLNVVLHKGLDARLRALESSAAAAPESVRADIRYPGDFVRTVNRGRVDIGTFNLADQLAAADAIAAGVKGGKDTFIGRTGDFERHYVLDGANEIMPYRVYVPKNYSASRATALVIALHGLGGTEDAFFDNYSQLSPQLAEKHGFLLAAPLGYRVDGFYGSSIMGASDAAARRRVELSEKDVLEVLRRMKAAYNVDEARIYLIGHSMGAIGTWYLGAKYPDIWAALAPFSGAGSPNMVEAIKNIPQFVVHGDNDPTVNVNGSRTMVAALKKAGANVTYIEVAGGNHTDMVVPNLPQAFEFFAAQKKGSPATTQQKQ